MEEKEITKIEKFKKIPTLSNEEYQLFLSKEYKNWYYKFISYAFECISFNFKTQHMNFWFIEFDNKKVKKEDIKNLILLLSVYLNYCNDKHIDIHYGYSKLEHISYNNLCYFKENNKYFRFNREIFFLLDPYEECYAMAFCDSKYVNEKQVVTFDMLQSYVLEKLAKVEDNLEFTSSKTLTKRYVRNTDNKKD